MTCFCFSDYVYGFESHSVQFFTKQKSRPIGRLFDGGERGIRTLGACYRTPAFQASTFDHSDISPCSTALLVYNRILKMSIVKFKKIAKICFFFFQIVCKGYLRDFYPLFCYNQISKGDDFMRDIGKNIKDLRVARNMTQDQLAEKLFVTRQTVSNYENGKSRPDIDMITQMGEILECEISDIIYGIPSKKGKKQEYIKLAAGAVLTIAVIVLFEFLSPIARQIKGTHYLSSFSFFIAFTLLPLKWLFAGWTIMQLAGFAFKNKINPPAWTRYIRSFLVGFILVYFLVVTITLLPTVVNDFIFIKQKSIGIHTVYTSSLSPKIANSFELIISHLLYFFVFPYELITPIFLSSGILLWLCGFPKLKNHSNIKQ